MMNIMAPEIAVNVSARPKCDWLTAELFEQRKTVWNRERNWKKYSNLPQWKAFMREQNRYNRMLQYWKGNNICGKVLEKKDDTKELYKYINKLAGKEETSPMPSSSSDKELSDMFANFFHDKIANIRNELKNEHIYTPAVNESIPKITCFAVMSSKYIERSSWTCPLNHVN